MSIAEVESSSPPSALPLTDDAAEPLLFSRREAPPVVSGSTTVSSVSITRPVSESGPDD
jgi:hypothetical protein